MPICEKTNSKVEYLCCGKFCAYHCVKRKENIKYEKLTRFIIEGKVCERSLLTVKNLLEKGFIE